jgi:hypothetical protein
MGEKTSVETWPGTVCQGSGRKWGSGTGQPVCHSCHRGWQSLGLKRRPAFTSKVPTHEMRKP